MTAPSQRGALFRERATLRIAVDPCNRDPRVPIGPAGRLQWSMSPFTGHIYWLWHPGSGLAKRTASLIPETMLGLNATHR